MTNTATAAEIATLTDLLNISKEARGDHEVLAEVRRLTAAEIDAFLANLASHGVDTDALLDQIDPE